MLREILPLAIALAAMSASAQSPDCRDLKLIERLSRIGDLRADWLAMVAELRVAACAASNADNSRWKNGSTAKRNGRWHFPGSSVTVVAPDGRLAYPSAVTARRDGRWFYPNAVSAMNPKLKNPRQLPSGRDVTEQQLEQWACKRLTKDQCDAGVNDIASSVGDERELALIEFAWKADRAKR